MVNECVPIGSGVLVGAEAGFGKIVSFNSVLERLNVVFRVVGWATVLLSSKNSGGNNGSALGMVVASRARPKWET